MKLLREALPDFSWQRTAHLPTEAMAGITGALLVIPQAITFAYLAGLAPEYGLYCAVFVGLLASVFGRSPMVGGPNTGVSILIGLSVLPFAGRGSPLYVDYVLALSLMVGLIQLAIWLLRGAEVFRYFSPAAIVGIKVGVGLWLITSAVEGAAGLSPMTTKFFNEKFLIALSAWSDLVNPYAALLAGLTVGSGLWLKPKWPKTYIFGAVLIGSLAGGAIYGWLGPVHSQLELLGHVTLQALPLHIPTLGPQQLLMLEQTFPQAVAIAVLGLAQSLVIARDLKATVVPDLDLHREVFAQGIANTAAPFFSTFAGSGSFNRTSVNVEMGSRTPLAGIVAALGVVVIAFFLGPLLTWLPMPVIAGVLALVGIGMIKLGEIRPLMNRIDGPVILITLLVVILEGLETGILVAVVLSVIFFVAGVAKVRLTISDAEGTERIAVIGTLFYASLDRLAGHLKGNAGRHTVLDLRRVSYCDGTALAMIRCVQSARAKNGGSLVVEFGAAHARET